MAIRFFATKCKILQLYPNGHSLFYSEIRNFIVLLKRPFVFLQWNAKFCNSSQAAISFFYNETQDFENCTQTAIRFLQRNTEFWKLYLNGNSYFPQGNTRSNYLSSIFFHISFLKNGGKKINKYDFEISCCVFLQWKTNLEAYLTLNYTLFTKRFIKI